MNGQQLKQKREKLGMSQFALAKLASVSRYNISLFETGYYEFKKTDIEKIQNAIKKYKEKK